MCKFPVSEVDLGGCVDVLEDHVAVLENVINKVLDRGIFHAWEKSCAFAQLNAVVDGVIGLSRSVNCAEYW